MTDNNGCGSKHLKLTLWWVGIMLIIGGALYGAVVSLQSRVDTNTVQVIRNDERLKNIERNTDQIKRLLEQRRN